MVRSFISPGVIWFDILIGFSYVAPGVFGSLATFPRKLLYSLKAFAGVFTPMIGWVISAILSTTTADIPCSIANLITLVSAALRISCAFSGYIFSMASFCCSAVMLCIISLISGEFLTEFLASVETATSVLLSVTFFLKVDRSFAVVGWSGLGVVVFSIFANFSSGLAVGFNSGLPSADFNLEALNAFLTSSLPWGDGLTSSPIFADANGSSPPTLTSLPGNSSPNFACVYSSDASNLSSTAFFLFFGVDFGGAERINDDASGLSRGTTTVNGVLLWKLIFVIP